MNKYIYILKSDENHIRIPQFQQNVRRKTQLPFSPEVLSKNMPAKVKHSIHPATLAAIKQSVSSQISCDQSCDPTRLTVHTPCTAVQDFPDRQEAS